MWNRRTAPADTTTQKQTAPGGSTGSADAQQDRKPAKMQRSKLGVSESSMSKPESSSVAAEGKIPKVAEHSDTAQDSADVKQPSEDAESSQAPGETPEPESSAQLAKEHSDAGEETPKQSLLPPIAEIEQPLLDVQGPLDKSKQNSVDHGNDSTDTAGNTTAGTTEVVSNTEAKDDLSTGPANHPGVQSRKHSKAIPDTKAEDALAEGPAIIPGAQSRRSSKVIPDMKVEDALAEGLANVPDVQAQGLSKVVSDMKAEDDLADGPAKLSGNQIRRPSKAATELYLPVTEPLATASATSVTLPSPPQTSPASSLPKLNLEQAGLLDTIHDVQRSINEVVDAVQEPKLSVPSVDNPGQLNIDPPVPSAKSITGKLTKRRSLLQKTRKLLMRRRLLALLLGRELGNITHSGLAGLAGLGKTPDAAVDGVTGSVDL